jgi:hypothetical protein
VGDRYRKRPRELRPQGPDHSVGFHCRGTTPYFASHSLHDGIECTRSPLKEASYFLVCSNYLPSEVKQIITRVPCTFVLLVVTIPNVAHVRYEPWLSVLLWEEQPMFSFGWEEILGWQYLEAISQLAVASARSQRPCRPPRVQNPVTMVFPCTVHVNEEKRLPG